MKLFQLVSFASSRLASLGRSRGDSVLATSVTDSDVDQESEVFAAHGIVSRPSKATRGIRIRLGNLGIVIAAYTYGVDPPANPGAVKVYSTDEDGTEHGSHLIDDDGTHVFNGGEDWAVRYSALESAFNQLKSDFDTFASTHTHPGVTPGSSSTGTAVATPSTADITGAKVEEILIP